jgi:hypothetical protein
MEGVQLAGHLILHLYSVVGLSRASSHPWTGRASDTG